MYQEGERLVLPGPGLASFDDLMYIVAFCAELPEELALEDAEAGAAQRWTGGKGGEPETDEQLGRDGEGEH